MRLTTFWHVLIGLNMGLAVLSWSLQDMSLVMLNFIAAAACTVAAWCARLREENLEEG